LESDPKALEKWGVRSVKYLWQCFAEVVVESESP
jgi:hypothetical protein